MSKEYRHIKQYEKEIFELKDQGLTHRQIGERLGFTRDKIKDFFKRYNRTQRKISSGIEIKPKGRPRKNGTALPPSVQQLSGVTQLQYELAMKERHIKSLEMENELMRDFLSHTERMVEARDDRTLSRKKVYGCSRYPRCESRDSDDIHKQFYLFHRSSKHQSLEVTQISRDLYYFKGSLQPNVINRLAFFLAF